ncbi:hypothetical protein FRX31_027526 [Thalictrum thalictroides]|uniref:Uncharacterized protein n=1 Tax=Thalictrum thalictroides TaxID=46969 RepID=A0A7J6VDR4_THATH|nr:hypothetical protein FRX31_027526 [Thalictrum thalictroides]
MLPNVVGWDVDKLNFLLPPPLANAVSNVLIGSPEEHDRYRWFLNDNGKFSVKSAYGVVSESRGSSSSSGRLVTVFNQWCEEDTKQGVFHLSYVVFLLYEIWMMRNYVRFERIDPRSETLFEQVNLKAKRLWSQWHGDFTNTASENINIQEWLNGSNYLDCDLIYTDATFDKYSNNYSVAAVYKNSSGDIQAMAYKRGRIRSVIHAELMAIEVGMLLAKKGGWLYGCTTRIEDKEP